MAAAWEDTDAEQARRRELLQEISDRLVLITVRLAHRRGLFKGWQGDIAADTTPIPAWHHEPRERRGLASVELTAGWHHCGGSEEGVFGHSASLLVAASRRHPTGHPQADERVSRHPQIALGLVLDTPGKRIGPNAVHSLAQLTPFGFPRELLAADRACTDQRTEHFAQPVRTLGYQLVLDYKQQHRGVQGTHQGALLVDGSLACPAMPHTPAHATAGLDDKAVRGIDDSSELRDLIAAREPYFLKLKESADPRGVIRLQCPAGGPSPAVSCPRFNQVHRVPAPRPAMVDLTSKRATAAHACGQTHRPDLAKRTAAAPATGRVAADLPEAHNPPGALGKFDKFRQDRHYLHPAWQDAYRPEQANIEGTSTAEPKATASTSPTPRSDSPTDASPGRPARADDLQHQPAHPLQLTADHQHPSNRRHSRSRRPPGNRLRDQHRSDNTSNSPGNDENPD
ncbi:hypothetical protein ACIOHE_29110 [Streptomyces sp. NPDC087851]|uniref:hypothetical protein n=1 Tax=Streptomyces sp. NPDC087851 TaxID=3365810 RepID=UPI0038003A08